MLTPGSAANASMRYGTACGVMKSDSDAKVTFDVRHSLLRRSSSELTSHFHSVLPGKHVITLMAPSSRLALRSAELSVTCKALRALMAMISITRSRSS